MPADDAWRQAAMGSRSRHGYKLQPMCKARQHRSEIMEIEEFSKRYALSLDTPILLVQMRLLCRDCSLPAGYFYWWNPMMTVRFHE